MKKSLYLLTALVFTLLACIEPFDPGIVGTERKLVVDGTLTNKINYVKIQLSFSAGYNSTESVFERFARGGTVTIVDDRGSVLKFVEENSLTGLYVSEKPFAAEFGRSYTLVIKLDGKEYRSNPEKMLPVADISKVSTQFERNTDPNPKAIGRFDLFVDTQDPANRTDFYRWDWKHYRRINYCRTQRAGASGETVPPIIGYKCCGDCWDLTICNGCVNIASDQFANGAAIARQRIGSIDYDSREPYYIIIEQQSLSKEGYNFWKSVREQTSNSGGIFDTPPTFIKGNLSNVNDKNELVLGYFGVSAVSTKAFYLDRNVTGVDPFEKVQNDRNKVSQIAPDCVECREGPLRTSFKPEGWYDIYQQ
jgi:hypothetical protein